MGECPAKEWWRGNALHSVCDQFRLILPEATAIGVRLSHASREGKALGTLLSNTRITYPAVGHNLGKLRIIPHSPRRLECSEGQRLRPLQDGSAAYQAVVGVTDPLTFDGYGPWERSPGDGF